MLPLLGLCGLPLASGYEQLAIRFYQHESVTTEWILLGHDDASASGNGFRVDSSSGRVERLSYTLRETDTAADVRLAPVSFDTLSGWWPKTETADWAERLTEDGATGRLYLAGDNVGGDSGIRLQFSNETRRYREVGRQIPFAFETETAGAPVQQQLFWPRLSDPAHSELENSLEAWWRAQSAGIIEQQLERQGPYPLDGDPRPWKFDWDLQWLSIEESSASALLFARIYSESRSSGFKEKTVSFKRQADGQWIVIDPLADFGSASDIREAIRHALNAQDADGDFFAKHYPDVLNPDTRPFRSLRFGDQVLCLFSAGVVAPPAYDMIAVLIERP